MRESWAIAQKRACSGLDLSADEGAGDPDGGGAGFLSRDLRPLGTSRHSRLLVAQVRIVCLAAEEPARPLH